MRNADILGHIDIPGPVSPESYLPGGPSAGCVYNFHLIMSEHLRLISGGKELQHIG